MSSAFLLLACALVISVHADGVCRNRRQCNKEVCGSSYDVAIVGAGPGGANSAYMLRESGLDIAVFEYSDRVGGRLFTYQLPNTPDVNLEIGGMRFIEGAMHRLWKVISELGLTPKVFKEGFGKEGRQRFYLRGQSLTKKQVKSGDVPYDLSPEEKANQGRLVEYYLEKLTGLQLNGGPLKREVALKLTVPDGRFLYDLTFDEALDLVASPEGKEFTRDTHVFTSEVTLDASAISIFDDHLGEDYYGSEIYTLEEGMSSVPQGLLQTFLDAADSNEFYPNNHLKALRRRTNGQYVLYFEPTTSKDGQTTINYLEPLKVVCAQRVILAMPVYALSQLDWKSLRNDRATQAYSAVRPMPASKVFMTFDQPWWLQNERKSWVTKSDTLFSQMYDWQKSKASGDYILIASYADGFKAQYLRELKNQGEDIPGSDPGYNQVTAPLKDAILDHLTEAYGVERDSIPEPVTAASQFWTDYPFGCGWITWRAGYHFDDVISTMRRPSLKDEVYVVGSDYSWGLISSWIEGALETSENVINDYFL
ncbi:L-amino-acid oxidase-like [Aplysia californica]|uniref:L-amino-acid oxidase-like n=1 Tax=Aplysia californica TaxID=6500 RepID=A0ABM0JXU7_APLCA|nr:L-amino-acid oxidase-like [Aplysia californica]